MPDLSPTFEIRANGTTFTSQKLTTVLRGKASRILAYVMKEAAGYSQEQIEAEEWLQAAISGAMVEHMPGLMWDFIRPQDKPLAGTFEQFIDPNTLDVKHIAEFHYWLTGVMKEANDFFGDSAAKTEQPSPSETSMQPSAGDMDGQTTTAPN